MLQVADADVLQEAEPLLDLAQDQLRDPPVVLGQLELAHPGERTPRRQRRELVDRQCPPTSTARDSGRSRAPLQSGHGRSVMYSSIFSLTNSDSVSR